MNTLLFDLYEYGFKTLRKYQPDKGEIADRPSFCEAIGMDLAELLKEVQGISSVDLNGLSKS
ncbi:MAG: hypothetical protein WA960_15180 [Tunicatimonas sp.]